MAANRCPLAAWPSALSVSICMALLFAFSARASAQACFISAPSIVTGQHPKSVAVADFNGDGKLDFATADPPVGGNLGVSVVLGNGNGTFRPPLPVLVGFQPSFVNVGDFNHDGNPDLVVGDLTYCVASVIYILLGNGDGTFQPPVSYAVDKAGLLLSIAVADLNGDGVEDLAVINSCSADVSVLLGKGDGTFLKAVNYGVLSPASIATADVDGDGRLDLAVASGSGDISILKGNGDGTFQAATSFNIGSALIPTAIAAADLNHDGHTDLVVANTYGGSFNFGTADVLLGNGDGSFQAPVSYDSGENSEAIVIADLNGDRIPDLALATLNTDGVNILLGNGDGGFRYGGQFTAGDGSMSIASGDFNRDGALDLVVANNGIGTTFNGNVSPGNVSLLLGNGDGTFQSGQNTVAGREPTSVAAADLNGDGKADLAVVDFNGALNIFLGRGDGSFDNGSTYEAGTILTSVVSGDFNHDGRMDLVTATLHTNGIGVFLGNGDGTFQKSAVYHAGTNPRSIAVGDFNGDGNLDLAVADEVRGSPGNVSILLGNSDGTFQPLVAYAAGFRPKSVAVGDFNGDGKLDLAVANFTSHNVSVLLGNGNGTFRTAVNYLTGREPRSVAVGDFNGDGKLDLVVANSGTSKVTVFLGNGDGTFQKAVRYAAGHAPNFIAVADFNGDGRQDLVVTISYTASHGNGSVAVLLGNGDGTFQFPTYYGTGLLPRSAAVADFNGDGAPDVAIGNYTSNNVTVLLNRREGRGKAR
ncbi:MAG: VCBS repeat-containing protein [Acidobacteriia bacterium]|nr:VCBS repeat-containing protein [Terriglobia bacterium]